MIAALPPVVCRVVRGPLVECLHRGDMVFVDSMGRVQWSLGDPQKKTFMRSSAKPIQVLPVIESGAAARFGFSDREIAVMCGSHSGQDQHVETVKGVLEKLGLDETALGCGTHPPLYRPQAASLVKMGRRPSPLHNNCSGKHSGMLALAVHLGLPLDRYWEAGHPVQDIVKRVVAETAAYPEKDIMVGVDGCGVSVFALPLFNMALAYARLASPGVFAEPRRSAVEIVMGAVAANPLMIAGTGRFCTAIAEVTHGRIIGKEGADGVYCAAVRDRGVGFAFKVEDGHSRVMGPVVTNALLQMGMLDEGEADALRDWRRPALVNHRGEDVGFAEAAFQVHK